MSSVCFIITTYNRKTLLQKSIDSVLSEMVDGDLLLVVDDASSDDTDKLMEELTYLHKNIHYYRMPENSGINKVRQQAIAQVCNLNTDWLTFIDDDDVLIKEVRACFSELHGSMPEQKWIAFPSIDPSGKLLSKYPKQGIYSYIEDYMGRRIIRGDFQHFIQVEIAKMCTFATQFKNAEEWYFWCQIAQKSSWFIANNVGVEKQYLPEGLSKSGFNRDKELLVARMKVESLQGVMSDTQFAKQLRNLGKAYLKAKDYEASRHFLYKAIKVNPFLFSTYKYLIKGYLT